MPELSGAALADALQALIPYLEKQRERVLPWLHRGTFTLTHSHTYIPPTAGLCCADASPRPIW